MTNKKLQKMQATYGRTVNS